MRSLRENNYGKVGEESQHPVLDTCTSCTEQRAQPPKQAGQTAPPPDMRGAIDAFVTQLQQQQVNLWHDADQTQSAAINAALLRQQQIHPTLQEQQRIRQQDEIERQQGKQGLIQIQRQFQLSPPEEQHQQTAQSFTPHVLDSNNSAQPVYATQEGMRSYSTPQPATESHSVYQIPQQTHAYIGYSEPATSNREQLYYAEPENYEALPISYMRPTLPGLHHEVWSTQASSQSNAPDTRWWQGEDREIFDRSEDAHAANTGNEFHLDPNDDIFAALQDPDADPHGQMDINFGCNQELLNDDLGIITDAVQWGNGGENDDETWFTLTDRSVLQ